MLKSARDPFSEWLDKKYGATVNDNNIFTTLPRYWENEFHKDMKSLNVRLSYNSITLKCVYTALLNIIICLLY